MSEEKEEKIFAEVAPAPESKHKWLWIVIITAIVIAAAVIFVFSAMLLYQRSYQDKVYPGVYVNGYHLGSLKREDVKNLLESYNNRLSKEGVNFSFTASDGKTTKFKMNVLSADDGANELVRVDSERISVEASSIGREGGFWNQLVSPWYYRWIKNKHFFAPVSIDEKNFNETVHGYLAPYEDPGRNANIKIRDLSIMSYDVVGEKAGVYFDYDEMLIKTRDNLGRLSLDPIQIERKTFSPSVKKEDAAAAAANLSGIFSYGDIGLNYIDSETNARKDWYIQPSDLASWLEVRKEGVNSFIGLQEEAVKKYLEVIGYEVDRLAADAKFIVEEGKVKEFTASRAGAKLNVDKTYADLDQAFRERNYHPEKVTKTVTISVDIVQPAVKLSDINNIGVTDVIGTGTSTFYDSHNNRIRNIANAVKRLNGTLIAPGEEFSTINGAGPFISENGYLPEEVIKGREIKKEIGGGMCQIGTTLFRMAMNSGMPITERRNHSLVVNYYADPYNHNPGTDATVYEPLVDFKFLNDTGNYLLLQTSIDYKKQMLTFSLWGKNDGRGGSYSRPLVSRWIPAGELEEIYTKKLEPGVTKCQAAFRGAVASFLYTRFTSTTEKIERVFESYYRPLPKTCMIGAAEIPAGCKDGQPCAVKPAVEAASSTTQVAE